MHVTLYTKPGCHLCDEVKADLLAFQREIGFALSECNIETSPADFARYQYLIPVVDIANGPLLYAPIDAYALRTALETAARQDESQ